jgi:hypothetical protein
MVSLDDAMDAIMHAQGIEDKGLHLIVLSYDTTYHAKKCNFNFRQMIILSRTTADY